MIHKRFQKAILVLLAICGVLSVTPQTARAYPAEDGPGHGVVIGFIDSGIAPYHLDETHILPGKNYVFGDADTVDRIGHGTKTAGMVLGSKDGSVKGTCPEAFAVPLVTVDRYPSGVIRNGGTAALVSAIYDAVDVFGCSIINISLCTAEDSDALKAAVDYACAKGVLLICAAGNRTGDETVCYPAHYDGVITVGSSSGKEIAGFSQTSDADFFCEGKDVPVVSYKKNGKTGTDSGTSFSCAAVTGICARLLAKDPLLTAEDVRSILLDRCMEGTPNILDLTEAYAAEPQSAVFRDTVGHWAEKEIAFCAAEGIFNGNGDGTFLPDGKMTRAMFVTALWNLAGRPQAECSAGFTDVAEGSWYAGAVDWAFEQGLAKGINSEEFAPDSFVIREQACVFLMRYASFAGCELPEGTKVSFTDEGSISSWARTAVGMCASTGIIHGCPDHSFNPSGEATRAECCVIFRNFLLAARNP